MTSLSPPQRPAPRPAPGNQGWLVVDLGTDNGTQVNGQDVPARESVLLHGGDRLHLGAWTQITISLARRSTQITISLARKIKDHNPERSRGSAPQPKPGREAETAPRRCRGCVNALSNAVSALHRRARRAVSDVMVMVMVS
jgi:hypothetical protein